MNSAYFPWIAVALGSVMLAILTLSGNYTTPGGRALPLLAMLFMAELGGLICAGGAFIAFRSRRARRGGSATLLAGVLCTALALALLYSGITLWQQSIPA